MNKSTIILLLLLVAAQAQLSTHAAQLKAIQSGEATIGTGSNSATVPITAVDPAKAFLVFSTRTNVDDPVDTQVSGNFSTGRNDELTFARHGTGASARVRWYLVEFVSGVSVQRGSASLTGTTTTVNIGAVDLTKSFPLISYREPGTNWGGKDFVRGSLPSATQLQLDLAAAPTPPAVVEWQVVEYADAVVHAHDVTMASNQGLLPVTPGYPIDPSKTWLIYSYTTGDSGTKISRHMVRGFFNGGGGFSFDRYVTGVEVSISAFVVEFTDVTTVQQGTASWAIGPPLNLPVSIPIGVDLARSIAVGGYLNKGGKTNLDENDSGISTAWAEMILTGSNSMIVYRGRADEAAQIEWSVLEFSAPVPISTISGEVFEDADFAGSASGYDGGAVDKALGGVDVELYDGGTDAYITSTTTAGDGSYSFGGLANGSYKVRVRSATIGSGGATPKGGLNASVPLTWPNPLGEMTWANGAAAYGGQSPTVDDTVTADDGGPGDTYVSVSVSGADVSGVDFGFAYNLIVNTDDDLEADVDRSKQGSLRQFIKNANAIGTAGGTTANSSRFRIPGAGPHTIQPVQVLPLIDDPLVLDGYTQPGAQANSVPAPGATDAVLLIELDGTNAGAGVWGLAINAGDTTVRGLVINRFGSHGILVQFADGNTIEGNYIGTDVSGSADLGNGGRGILISSGGGHTVGGLDPGDRNVISGNTSVGVNIHGSTSSGNLIQGNFIGVNAAGNAKLGNDAQGVYVRGPDNVVGGAAAGAGNLIGGNLLHGVLLATATATGNKVQGNFIGTDLGATQTLDNAIGVHFGTDAADNLVGGTEEGEGNTVAFNRMRGIVAQFDAGTRNSFLGNRIHHNSGLGIDLGNDNVTENDPDDVGPNDLLNFPEITQASFLAGTISVDFDLEVPAGDYRIEFYKNPSGGDPSGNGEGEIFADWVDITHGGTGVESFSHSITGIAGDIITATTTECTDGPNCSLFGSTSEFSDFAMAQVFADLTLTKSDGPDPAPVDGPLVYTLVVTNHGPGTATGVSVTDDLPDSVTLVQATPSQGSCVGTDPVVCSLGAIVSSGTASVEILVTTSSTGTIINEASVTADQVDPVPADNSASEETEVVADSAIIDVPLTQYRRIHGFVDYTVTGGSLRTQPNQGGGACVVSASSTGSLAGIPGTATVRAAYLYWAASGSTVDDQVTFDGTAVTADRTFRSRFSLGANDYDFFGGFEDVTGQVAAEGNGSYTFEDLTIDTGAPYCSSKAVLGGWTLIVVYEDTGLTGKTLVLYDGFDLERNGAVSYLLTGIYSADPPEAKTTFLVWEGDDDLGGASEVLEFNGVAQSDGLNPVNNVYNSTINSLGSTTSYGMDLDTFDVSGEVSAGDTLATTRVSVGSDLVILNAVVLQAKSNIIAGKVFEDVNYGGGAGRNLATAAAAAPSFTVARPGAVVELYAAGGAFLRTTLTGPTGEYGFTGLVDGDYQVRVVNETVDSSRPGATLSEWPVQTFRTDASSGTALPVVGEVGGASPPGQDSGPNVAMAALGTITAQSVSPVRITTGIAVHSVDFGYNFDTIVNTNAAGQGSLHQFILNSNDLTNANLEQNGLTAGKEHSLFMIPSDNDPYGRAKDPGFVAARGVAVILLDTPLPPITDIDTAIDGTTQTVGVEDSNTATLGAGGNVGVDGLALPTLAGPEIEIVDDAGLISGIDVQADDVTVRGVAIYGFGPALNTGNIRVGLDNTTNFTGVTIEDNVLGGFADNFTDPDLVLAGSGTDGASIAVLGADFGTLQRNLIGFSGRNAAVLSKAANDWTVEKNEFRAAGLDDARSDGLGLTEDVERASVTGNLFADNQGAGVDYFSGVGNNTLLNNTFDGNGQGGVETAGVRMFGADGVIDRNVFNNQAGSGVLAVVSDPAFPTANTPAIRQRISRNHFGGNGANAIDLQTTLDIIAPGDGITLNDGTLLGDSSVANACGTVATHGNEGLDTPIIDLVLLGGGGATVRGRACPGAAVEIYRAVADGDASDSLGGTDYGEGVTYLTSATAAAGTGLFEATGIVGLSAGDAVAALAIDSNDNTSEFSGNVVAQALPMVKHAFQSDGTPIASGSTLASGTTVKFILYISNPGEPIADVSMQDILDPDFLYVAGSIKYDNSVASCAAASCTVAEEAAIFAAADSGTIGSDAVDGDVVSFTGVTLDVGNQSVANAQLDIAAGRVWAVIFTIRMQ